MSSPEYPSSTLPSSPLIISKNAQIIFVIRGFQKLMERFLGSFSSEKSLKSMGYTYQRIKKIAEADRATLYIEIVLIFRLYSEKLGSIENWKFTELCFGLNGTSPMTLVALGKEHGLSPAQVAYRIEKSLRELRKPIIHANLACDATHHVYRIIGYPRKLEARCTFF